MSLELNKIEQFLAEYTKYTPLRMNCEALRLGPVIEGRIPCAVRLFAPQNVHQTPTHFILLCDVSESMLDNNKLVNIKRCAELVVGLLSTKDSMSLITFGESATLHFKRMEANETNKATMCSVLRGLHCDGCTNLSAGLGYVREVCEDSVHKTGLLILTDGYANRGIYEPEGLCRIVQGIRRDFENLSVHCVAYGTNHNTELLRAVAEDSQGSYAIVNTIEDTASAFGDTLGGLMSCVMQNTEILVPAGSIVHGPLKTRIENSVCKVELGDVYAGTNPLILVDIPEAEIQRIECINVKGMELPDLRVWRTTPILTESEGRQIDIELVKLRYMCTDILKTIMKWGELTTSDINVLETRLDTFIICLNDEDYNGNPVADLLRGEIPILRDTLARARVNRLHTDDGVILSQRIATIGLGRGLSTPRAPSGRRHQSAQDWNAYNDLEDPDVASPSDIGSTTSGFQNSMQLHLSQVLRAASQQPTIDQ